MEKQLTGWSMYPTSSTKQLVPNAMVLLRICNCLVQRNSIRACLHAIIIRAFAYTAGASCLSAMLPVFIKEQLHAGPQTLGLLFAFFGFGAIAGAYPMQKLRSR